MDERILNDWWQNLKIAEKERIASKLEGREMKYPACTWSWVQATHEQREKVYDHCVNHHGLEVEEWREGKSMSY